MNNMGVYLNLIVKFKDISPEKWETTYHESVVLLKQFPAPLMRLSRGHQETFMRYFFSSGIVQNDDLENENWKIEGDSVSCLHAESFQLYRRMENNYFIQREFYDRNVLWADQEYLGYIDGNGVDVFGDKTQGRPYHLAVLAVGILFESRFPESIYLIGDIKLGYTQEVIAWMNTVLDTPVVMPICLDALRLYTRLNTLYDDSSSLLQRFRALFRGTAQEELAFFLGHDRSAVFQELILEFHAYSSLSHVGATRLIKQILDVTHDLKLLIDIVSKAGKGEKFSLEELLRVLCNQFLTIDVNERRLLFGKSNESLETIDDVIRRSIMTMTGICTYQSYYIDHTELLEIFCTYIPENRDSFNQVILESETNCRKKLAEIRHLSMAENEHQAATETTQGHAVVQSGIRPVVRSKPILHGQEYILHEIQSQKKAYKDSEVTVKQMGTNLMKQIQGKPDLFQSADPKFYLKNISLGSQHNQIVLHELAWQRIDEEKNIEILKYLMALSLLASNEKFLCDWRIYILENPNLWEYLLPEKKYREQQLALAD
ncbi:MAG: hypothetical protein HY881_12050 [Deltaproteobacteria bacterium]|nr:hypothetical protein [Deltaproteobacteria bacterium]